MCLPEGGRSRGRFSLLGGVARSMVALLEGEGDFNFCWAGDGNTEGFGLRGAPAPESKQLTTMTALSEKTDGDWGGKNVILYALPDAGRRGENWQLDGPNLYYIPRYLSA